VSFAMVAIDRRETEQEQPALGALIAGGEAG
jgi:hypothetical protein